MYKQRVDLDQEITQAAGMMGMETSRTRKNTIWQLLLHTLTVLQSLAVSVVVTVL